MMVIVIGSSSILCSLLFIFIVITLIDCSLQDAALDMVQYRDGADNTIEDNSG